MQRNRTQLLAWYGQKKPSPDDAIKMLVLTKLGFFFLKKEWVATDMKNGLNFNCTVVAIILTFWIMPCRHPW